MIEPGSGTGESRSLQGRMHPLCWLTGAPNPNRPGVDVDPDASHGGVNESDGGETRAVSWLPVKLASTRLSVAKRAIMGCIIVPVVASRWMINLLIPRTYFLES